MIPKEDIKEIKSNQKSNLVNNQHFLIVNLQKTVVQNTHLSPLPSDYAEKKWRKEVLAKYISQ